MIGHHVHYTNVKMALESEKMEIKKKQIKKAQMKIQEMAFVLVAVIVLFGFILIFFTQFQLKILEKSAEEIRREEAINMLHTIAAMPELRCSEGGEVNCIDVVKVEAFMKVKSKYYNLWKNAFITKVQIEHFYPEGKNYVLYSTPGSSISYSTYVPLCSQKMYSSNCTIGKITVSSETV